MINVSNFEAARNGSCQVRVELSNGKCYVVGFITSDPLLQNELYKNLLKGILADYEKLSNEDLFPYLKYQFARNKAEEPLFIMEDSNSERVRIGEQIRALRTAKKMDSKRLAQLSGIDPANLCRIEQGKYSVGIDILNRIATALDAKFGLTANSPSFGKKGDPSLTRKVWVVPTGQWPTYSPINSVPEFGFTLWPITDEERRKYDMQVGDYVVFYDLKGLSDIFIILDPALSANHAEVLTREEQEYYWPRKKDINLYLKAGNTFFNPSSTLTLDIFREINRQVPKMQTEIMEIHLPF